MKQLNNKKGFTLIEVVLVLAIGGLIFLLAFVAFQQVSRNRRDTQRRADAGRFLAEIQNAKGDGVTIGNQTALNNFVNHYLKGPSGPNGLYQFENNISFGTSGTTTERVAIMADHKCSGNVMDGAIHSGNNAVMVKLESGGSVCRDDS